MNKVIVVEKSQEIPYNYAEYSTVLSCTKKLEHGKILKRAIKQMAE